MANECMLIISFSPKNLAKFNITEAVVSKVSMIAKFNITEAVVSKVSMIQAP